MPCYQINLVNVDLGNINLEMFIKSLQINNTNFYYDQKNLQVKVGNILLDFQNKIITYRENQENIKTVNSLKRIYSATVITEVAKKKRWILKQTENKFQLKKY